VSPRIGWLDCSSGVSGDMLLGALSAVGALDELSRVLDAVPDLGATVSTADVHRGALQARHVHVDVGEGPPRNRADVQTILESLPLPAAVRKKAGRIFDRLASAEATVHGVTPEEIYFHEIGAVDSIVDVVGSCLGFHALRLDGLTVSPIALGSGAIETMHGVVPVPGPAVLELLRDTDLVASGGDAPMELATPTGVAVLAELATHVGPMPAMSIGAVGAGAGSRELEGQPNVVRLVLGEAAVSPESWLLLEANVDDLDPRLWPGVIDALLAAGAADAWLTPILMKKGRPAHALSALAPASAAAAVERTVFEQTTTIGLRTTPVGKRALDRDWVTVAVDGHSVRVKVARLDGRVVTATPEWADVEAAARALGRPARQVLADAVTAARVSSA
jgi:pyridinium-3,5-bisthiocarboxylic acid mononucleotide nickel chelatase